jgi:GxxExxY protein
MHDPRFGPHTHAIIGACIEVHQQLGPGLLESAYEECLAVEMHLRGLRFERQPRVPLVYKGHRVEHAFQPDFVVDERVIVEVKAVHTLLAVHGAQLRTYLKLRDVDVGLLVNFNVPLLSRGGVRRVVLSSTSSPPRLSVEEP